MPCIEAKFSTKLTDTQKDDLQKKLSSVVSSAFGKPTQYIMVNIEDAQTLYLGESKLTNGAYIAVRLLGTVAKPACQTATKEICSALKNDLKIEGTDIYITYHPVDLWGWNGSMF
jgi:phenylpyruvate tautomerase PptA (4-oxalocrotonate tautomerase family)